MIPYEHVASSYPNIICLHNFTWLFSSPTYVSVLNSRADQLILLLRNASHLVLHMHTDQSKNLAYNDLTMRRRRPLIVTCASCSSHRPRRSQ